MGRRHSKNCTEAAVYSYHERRKDSAASGFGSEKARLGKDSIKGFDCCSLTLQPCRNPVITPDGWLYDKEVILKYILEKKAEYQRKLKAYEAQASREFKNLAEEASKDAEKQRKEFEKLEKYIGANKPKPSTSHSSEGVKDAAEGLRGKGPLPAYWVPSLTPMADKTKLQKPDKIISCPMSGKPLKVKSLVDVKFTLIDKNDAKSKSLISKEERYKCPVTNDVLRNSTPCAVLKPTGDVVTMECVNTIIKKDMFHPLSGSKLLDSDIILLQRGGTGFSAANETLKAKKYRPSLAIN